jgi:RNA-directed DNA polymerase
VEGRPLTKENAEEPNPHRTPSRESGPSGLDRVRQAAKGDKQLRFTALLHHGNVDRLRSSYYNLKRQAAAGVDGVTWQEYGDGLEERLTDLHGRIHRGAYRAKPSRRVWIPKRRWAATAIGYRGAGRQNRTVRGGAGSQPDLGRGLSGFFVRVPAGAPSQHDGLDALYVGITSKKVNFVRGLRHQVIFRQSRAWSHGKVRTASDRR